MSGRGLDGLRFAKYANDSIAAMMSETEPNKSVAFVSLVRQFISGQQAHPTGSPLLQGIALHAWRNWDEKSHLTLQFGHRAAEVLISPRLSLMPLHQPASFAVIRPRVRPPLLGAQPIRWDEKGS
jgi:hypothetical protein